MLKHAFTEVFFSFPQDWWQARRMDAAGNEVAAGLIPSRNRWEKRMRSRDRNVQWNDGMGTGKRTGSLKKMPFFKVSSNIAELPYA